MGMPFLWQSIDVALLHGRSLALVVVLGAIFPIAEIAVKAGLRVSTLKFDIGYSCAYN